MRSCIVDRIVVGMVVLCGAAPLARAQFESQKFAGSGGELHGLSTCVEGDWLAIGAPTRTGFGLPAACGAVDLYRRGALKWELHATLLSPAPVPDGWFGRDVRLRGGRLIVGEQATIGGPSGTTPGAAYVFERDGHGTPDPLDDTWGPLGSVLHAADTNPPDAFGSAVDIDGDVLVVGAFGDDGMGNGFSPGPAHDPNLGASGSVYVYRWSGSDWALEQKLYPLEAAQQDEYFGLAVSLDGDRIAIGEHRDDASGQSAGAVFVFERSSGSTWSQTAKIPLPNQTGIQRAFGFAVDLENDTLAIGAPACGNGSTDPQVLAGAAYVYRKSGSTWALEQRLTPGNATERQEFGQSIDLEGETLVVGAHETLDCRVSATIEDHIGAVYVFVHGAPGATWSEQRDLRQPDAGNVGHLGYDVSLSAPWLLAGAPNYQGANGAAYVYDLTSSAVTPFCFGDGSLPLTPCPCANTGAPAHGCANSAQSIGALLGTFGSTSIDAGTGRDCLSLAGCGMPAEVPVIYFQGDLVDPNGLVFGDGVRCAAGAILRVGSRTNVDGASVYPGPGNASISERGMVVPGSGVVRAYQAYYRNAASAFCPPATFNATNGIRVVW